ncbi:kielin/chordin-like protein [Orbicella faveolata]|uniref:kielin/chordin-like protein n=1 Tax=Orbicella faveolata TaxID=48498 RepID=UPI0009E635C9|nr:kielin/chordin-like protein [Orbicella faveolata]
MESRAFLQAFLVICLVVLAAEGEKHDTVEAEEEKVLSVRDLPVEIDYEPVGCFEDKKTNRSLDKLVKNFRKKQNLGGKNIWVYWKYNMSYIIQLCAEEAFRQGYTMFGMQYYGECWSGKDPEKHYNNHGKSRNCINGVGKAYTNYVYRIKVKPVQIKAPSSVCNVEGQTYDDGDSMEVYRGDLASGECEQCTCKEGKLDCHHIFHCVLNDSSCDSYVKKPDQCCPECQRDVPIDAPKCKVKDKTYNQGQSMEILQDYGGKQLAECHQCTCMDGKLDKCHRIYYCELNKPGCTNFIKSAGQCCPTCARVLPKPAPPSCKVGGRNYKDGASMEVLHMSYDQKNASCQQCRCKEGQVDGCHHIFHCTLDDPSCARYEKRSHEQCCPACVKLEPNPQSPGCKINGLLYKDGESAEVLQESADKASIICQQCKCEAGKHSCHKIFDCDIQKVACERSIKIPGQCCPECACFHNGEHLSPGDQWQKVSGDECVTCTCRKDGTANCTRMPGSCQSE